MRKFLLAALLVAASTNVMAEDEYQFLTASYNGVEQSFELATIKKITFEGTDVVITTTEGTVKLPQSEMEKMFFSSTATAIENMPLQSTSLQTVDGILRAQGKGMLHIYASNGVLMQMAKVNGSVNISLSTLPHGTYIVNMGDQTIKFIKP